MINIYCLVNPLTNKPFYVGATKGTLHGRLSGHIHESKTFIPKHWDRKHTLINEIIVCGSKPQIKLLFITPIYSAEYYELFFFHVLINQGFELLQSPPERYARKRLLGPDNKCNYVKMNGLITIYNGSKNNFIK